MAYQTLLTKNGDWRPSLGNLQFRVLEKDRSRSLEEPFWKKRCLKPFPTFVVIKSQVQTTSPWRSGTSVRISQKLRL